jgi:glycerol-3-phosphate acyltransferase PlsY
VAFLGQPESLALQDGRWIVTSRVQTGHQRAERAHFLDGGRLLAVTCPRYDRLVLYRIGEDLKPRLARDWKLGGKPVAVREVGDELIVLQRPSGDARHLEPGFWQRYDLNGEPRGEPFRTGYDPDDFVFLDHAPIALVLVSGNREGETNRPDPEVLVVDVTQLSQPRTLGRVALEIGAYDDPARLLLSRNHTHAGVLTRRGLLIGIALTEPWMPQITGSISIAGRARPALSETTNDAIVLPDSSGAEVELVNSGSGAMKAHAGGDDRPSRGVLATLDCKEGRISFVAAAGDRELGALMLHGPARLGSVRASGLAYCPQRELIAVADRSGGVHLLAFERAGPRP